MSQIVPLTILQRNLDRATSFDTFVRKVQPSGVRPSITIVHIGKFYKVYENIVRFRLLSETAKRSIVPAELEIVEFGKR